ncbi:ABC transporter substrate-binding protein [Parafrigoribacterium mesophilum]|uniref:ABC transporter substrate-binding protein n=1 Tax=Parafrigoribacterium mesophilum TaxID=433646 RepID=UPI0031FD9A91
MKHRTRIVTALAVVAITSTALAGCGAPSEPAPAAEKTLTLAVSSDSLWGFVRPDIGTQVHQSAAYWMPLYDTLVKITPDLEILPNLATDWAYNDDHTTLTLKLRDDVKFTDGTTLDAAAVVANLLAFRDGGGGEATQAASAMADATAKDPTTVVITFKRPDPSLLPALAATSGAVFAPSGIQNANKDKSVVPIGSGPYVLDEKNTTPGSVYTYVRNKDYWDAKAYPFDKLVLRPMADVAARMNALKAGEVDGASVPAANAADIEAGGFTLNKGIANWAGLHLLDRQGAVVPALADVRVRQAINMVFDREAIVKNLYQGYGVVNNQAFRESSAAYVPGVKAKYPYDVDGAKKLMAAAGYADGFDMSIPAIIGNHDAVMPIIKQQLGKIGIRLTVVPYQLGDYFKEIFAKKFGIAFVSLPSFDDWRDVKGMVTPTALWNVFKNQAPELDKLITTASMTEGAEQETAFKGIGTYLMDNAWYAPWATPSTLFATSDAITAKLSPGQIEPLIWDIKPAK